MRASLILAAALCCFDPTGLALAEPVPASNPPALSAQTEAHRAACDALAAIIQPETQVEPQADRLVDALLTQLFTQDSSMQQMEASYPGMRDAIGAGMKPVMFRIARAILPAYRAELSALYQANLTTGEARTATAFFSSPAIAKALDATRAGIDYKATIGDIKSEKPITADDLQTDLRASGTKVARTLSPQDIKAMNLFMASPLGLKLRAINPQKLAIDAKWANYTEPALEREVEDAVLKAMVTHIALTDPETAELVREELGKQRM